MTTNSENNLTKSLAQVHSIGSYSPKIAARIFEELEFVAGHYMEGCQCGRASKETEAMISCLLGVLVSTGAVAAQKVAWKVENVPRLKPIKHRLNSLIKQLNNDVLLADVVRQNGYSDDLVEAIKWNEIGPKNGIPLIFSSALYDILIPPFTFLDQNQAYEFAEYRSDTSHDDINRKNYAIFREMEFVLQGELYETDPLRVANAAVGLLLLRISYDLDFGVDLIASIKLAKMAAKNEPGPGAIICSSMLLLYRWMNLSNTFLFAGMSKLIVDATNAEIKTTLIANKLLKIVYNYYRALREGKPTISFIAENNDNTSLRNHETLRRLTNIIGIDLVDDNRKNEEDFCSSATEKHHTQNHTSATENSEDKLDVVPNVILFDDMSNEESLLMNWPSVSEAEYARFAARTYSILRQAYARRAKKIQVTNDPRNKDKLIVWIDKGNCAEELLRLFGNEPFLLVLSLKLLAYLDISERRKPQKGKIYLEELDGERIHYIIETQQVGDGCSENIVCTLASP